MFHNIVNSLIPNGIMNYLIENYYTKRSTFTKIKTGPKVLSMQDLAFGFNIWLGFCLISTLSFIAEWFIKRFWKKSTKIHPLTTEDVEVDVHRDPEFYNRFRIEQRTNQLNSQACDQEIPPQRCENSPIKTC
jgi:hypothetical protein